MSDRSTRYRAIAERNERVRLLRNSGIADEQIAADFRMGLTTVQKIKRGRS